MKRKDMLLHQYLQTHIVLSGVDGSVCLISPRHYEALKKAVSLIRDSNIPFRSIIMYGSCAKGEAGFDSDIDLFVDLDKDVIYSDAVSLFDLKGKLSDITDPPIDIHFGDLSAQGDKTYKENIKRDGVVLCMQ